MYVRLDFGRGFKGLLEYQFGAQKPKDHRVLGGNVMGDLDELKVQFYRESMLRPDIKKPVMHLFASWAPEDVVSDEQMQVVADRLLKSMDFDTEKHQYLVVRHLDTQNHHFHIVANRVAHDGSVFANRGHPAVKLSKEAKLIDAEMGFTPATPFAERHPEAEVEAPLHLDANPRVSHMVSRTGLKAAKHQVHSAIREAIRASDGDMESLDQEIRKRGVSPAWSFNAQGGFNGASFTLLESGRPEAAVNEQGESYTFKGSQVKFAKQDLEAALERRRQQISREQALTGRRAARQQERTERLDQQRVQRERSQVLDSLLNRTRVVIGSNPGIRKRRAGDYLNRLPPSRVRRYLSLFSFGTPQAPVPAITMPWRSK